MSSDEETRRAIYENVADGKIDIVGERDGEHTFRLNDAGVARVHEIVDSFIEAHGELAADAFAAELDVPVKIAAEIILKSRSDRGLT